MNETLREIMQEWDTNRARWIASNGSDEGFGAWFTDQVKGVKA